MISLGILLVLLLDFNEFARDFNDFVLDFIDFALDFIDVAQDFIALALDCIDLKACGPFCMRERWAVVASAGVA